jgi:hypothetical protein
MTKGGSPSVGGLCFSDNFMQGLNALHHLQMLTPIMRNPNPASVIPSACKISDMATKHWAGCQLRADIVAKKIFRIPTRNIDSRNRSVAQD